MFGAAGPSTEIGGEGGTCRTPACEVLRETAVRLVWRIRQSLGPDLRYVPQAVVVEYLLQVGHVIETQPRASLGAHCALPAGCHGFRLCPPSPYALILLAKLAIADAFG